jgi:hypothetical protein
MNTETLVKPTIFMQKRMDLKKMVDLNIQQPHINASVRIYSADRRFNYVIRCELFGKGGYSGFGLIDSYSENAAWKSALMKLKEILQEKQVPVSILKELQERYLETKQLDLFPIREAIQ